MQFAVSLLFFQAMFIAQDAGPLLDIGSTPEEYVMTDPNPFAPQSLGGAERSQLEPELGGSFRHGEARTGLEPELGSSLRQSGVYVDEVTCIGCRNCAHVASNTFFMEPEHGRARAMRQDGDPESLIQEAIDTCPVDCIQWVEYEELKTLEERRKDQIIPTAGFPVEKGLTASRQRQRANQRQKQQRRKDGRS